MPAIFFGAVLVTGSSVGGGMFSMPIVAAGMWFPWSLVCLCAIWMLSYAGGLIVLEAAMLFPRGASFNTIVKGLLGSKWNIANGIGVVFLLYILMYAYLSAGGSIANHTISALTGGKSPLSQNLASVIFGLTIALVVWLGTGFASRVCSLLLAGMMLTFLLFSTRTFLHIEISTLLGAQTDGGSNIRFAWAALPYLLTSFGYASLVPSLVKFYGHEPGAIRHCILYGTLACLTLYVLWLASAFGTLGRAQYVPAIQAGGNMGQLVNALQQATEGGDMRLLLGTFSNFAIISSFLAVGISLFDYIADGIGFGDDSTGRLKTLLITFLPPILVCYLFPQGFIVAIGYAGLVMIFTYFIVPARMALKIREEKIPAPFTMNGGSGAIHALLAFSVVIGLSQILAMADLLPVFP